LAIITHSPNKPTQPLDRTKARFDHHTSTTNGSTSRRRNLGLVKASLFFGNKGILFRFSSNMACR